MRRTILIALLAFAFACGSKPSRPVAHTAQTAGETQASAAQTPREAQPTRDGQTIAQTENDELTVYVTDTGRRYHLSTCRMLRDSRHAISLGEAKRRGYTACKLCQPPR